jgi:hypothetical protein
MERMVGVIGQLSWVSSEWKKANDAVRVAQSDSARFSVVGAMDLGRPITLYAFSVRGRDEGTADIARLAICLLFASRAWQPLGRGGRLSIFWMMVSKPETNIRFC